jgi:hypothetical protein
MEETTSALSMEKTRRKRITVIKSSNEISTDNKWPPFLSLCIAWRARMISETDSCLSSDEPKFVNVYGALDSTPRNRFRQAGNRFLGSLKGIQVRALSRVNGSSRD